MHKPDPTPATPFHAMGRVFALASLVLFFLLLEYAEHRSRQRRRWLPRRLDLPIMATRSLRLSSKGASR
ncbi:MAG TPA: hypothetical protein VN581_04775 [Patescibacteria group bacterium]|nr:hypothetical protein [Patescibacteria group bacterium]